jgi:type IV pilus assembly protein PilX
MKPASFRPVAHRPSAQRGVALAVVLILLVVMSLLALAGLRGTLMEERMTSNMKDRSLSFQSAEAALREGEAVAAGKPAAPAAGTCTKGLCGMPDPANVPTPAWETKAVWDDAYTATAAEGMPAANYIIELLADDVPPKGTCTTSGDISEPSCSGSESRYRITARSNVDGRAEVMLQSIYSVP